MSSTPIEAPAATTAKTTEICQLAPAGTYDTKIKQINVRRNVLLFDPDSERSRYEDLATFIFEFQDSSNCIYLIESYDLHMIGFGCGSLAEYLKDLLGYMPRFDFDIDQLVNTLCKITVKHYPCIDGSVVAMATTFAPATQVREDPIVKSSIV